MPVLDPKELVRRAYAAARASGKRDWHRMTLGVLKNRMLQLSDSSFRETDFGAPTFRRFLEAHPDLIRIDTTVKFPVAELLNMEGLESSPPAASGRATLGAAAHGGTPGRIRPDIWKAIVDYSTGRVYVWDSRTEEAREAARGESEAILPTLTLPEFIEWRRAFAAEAGNSMEGDRAERIRKWGETILPTHLLPRPQQVLWNLLLRQKIEERVRAWFAARGLTCPSNLLVSPTAPKAGPPTVRSDGDRLRDLVRRCIEVMTPDELRELRLPPESMLRAQAEKEN